MRILLDTHALLWNLAGSAKLSAPARAAINDPTNERLVSAATAWEVVTKYHLGKLPEAGRLVPDFTRVIVWEGYTPLSVTTDHAQDAGALPMHHRDPFDRVLIAQHSPSACRSFRTRRASTRTALGGSGEVGWRSRST